METTKNYSSIVPQYFIMTGIIVLACIALFSLDKGMHSPTDFFKPINLVAFAIYVTPTIIISFLLFRYFAKKHDRKKSTTLALVTGIPFSFALVIITIILFRP
jgi:hypothetical protein